GLGSRLGDRFSICVTAADNDLVFAPQGCRYLGHQYSDFLGLRHRQLCVVDRYWSRRNPYLGDSPVIPPAVAYFDKSIRRGNDSFCGNLCGAFPSSPYGATLAGLLAASISELDGYVASVQKPSGVGRFCCIHLPDSVPDFLVCGTDTRSSNDA